MIDWTPAWETSSVPCPNSTAIVIAVVATTAICQTPEPKKLTKMSPTRTPIATPIVTSMTRRSRCP